MALTCAPPAFGLSAEVETYPRRGAKHNLTLAEEPIAYAPRQADACRLAQFSRAAWYRRSQARDQSALRLRIRDLGHARPRFGYRRLWVLLRREGWGVNHKRVRRLYRLEGLQVRMRVRRRKHMHREPAPLPAGTTERWAMDFVHDALAAGRQFRILTVVRSVESLESIAGGGDQDVRTDGQRGAAADGRCAGTHPSRFEENGR